MTEKLICPYCEHRLDLDMIESADLFRERETLAAGFGPAWKIANEYVEAFRVRPGACMILKKRVRILSELLRLWTSCEFEFQGKLYRAAKPEIQAALITICNLEKTGFKDHNYLKKVLLSGSQRVSAEGLTAEEERREEEGKRSKRAAQQDLDLGQDMGTINYTDWIKGKGNV